MSEPPTSTLHRTRQRRSSDGASELIYKTQSAQNLYIQRCHMGKQYTYITCLMEDLRNSLLGLGISDVADEKIEEWAIFIHACMSGETRGYHSIDRIFEISAGSDAYQLLAGLFRDTINRFVDGGLSQKQLDLLQGVLEDDGFTLASDLSGKDSNLVMVASLFGLSAGQDLRASHRLDPLLSAVIMSRLLKDTLTKSHLALVIVCLEATIPFRPPNDKGLTALDCLYERLVVVNQTFDLGLSDDDLIVSIQRAADWSNRSLGNFSTEDASVFLDHTWSLLPELNSALRSRCLFTVADFQLATSNMVEFLTNLNPSQVFISFRGVPDTREMTMFNERTSFNLRLGCKYMRAELLGVSIVASFAVLTGGDAPFSFFTGDFPSSQHTSDRLAENFPTPSTLENDEDQVYDLLRRGQQRVSPETQNSPLAAYVYASLGDAGIRSALEQYVSCPMSQERARALLLHLPLDMVRLVGRDIAQIAISREEYIERLIQELKMS